MNLYDIDLSKIQDEDQKKHTETFFFFFFLLLDISITVVIIMTGHFFERFLGSQTMGSFVPSKIN